MFKIVVFWWVGMTCANRIVDVIPTRSYDSESGIAKKKGKI